ETSFGLEYWTGIAISPDLEKLARADLHGSVTVVALATGTETILNNPSNSELRGAAVSFSSDGQKVVVTFSHHYCGDAPTRDGGSKEWVTTLDFEIVEWTLEDSKKRQLWKDNEKDRIRYRNVAFPPDGKTLAYIMKKSAEDIADFEQEFVLEDA